jgi:RNA polymerase sigma factor FliA
MKRLAPADSEEVLALFHAELELVDIIARQLGRSIRSPIDMDDLLSAGREGLLDAARRYDPSFQVSFRSYANYRVRGAILDQIRQLAPLPRRTYARWAALEAASRVSAGLAEQVLGPDSEAQRSRGVADPEDRLDQHLNAVTLAAALRVKADTLRGETAAAQPPDPETAYERAELLTITLEALESLPVEEAQVIRRYYLEEHRLDAIAVDQGVSRSWVSRLHTKAITRLSARLNPAGAQRAP